MDIVHFWRRVSGCGGAGYMALFHSFTIMSLVCRFQKISPMSSDHCVIRLIFAITYSHSNHESAT